MSVACTVFDPKLVKNMSREQQVQNIRVLAQYLNVCEDNAVAEWNIFRPTLLSDKNGQKTASDMFTMLITSDLADSFSCLTCIAQAIVSCPVGTAG